MTRQYLLWSSTAAIALAIGTGGAVGQTAPATAQAAPAGGLEEVVVTAEKRSEDLQKAPLVVDSVDAEQLAVQHIVNQEDLMEVAPELHVDFGGPAPTFSMRGVGASTSGPNGSPGVTVNQDGAYMGTLLPQLLFYDVDHVEVAAGPQGTLWGGNSTGGTINIITKKPTHKTEGYATLEAGNFGLARFEGALNVPLADKIDARIAATFMEHSGWLNDGYDDADDKALRMTVVSKPTDALSIRLLGDYSNRGGQSDNIYIGPFTTGAFQPLTSKNAWSPPNTLPTDQREDFTNWFLQAEINYDFGWATLTYLPGYRESTRFASNYRFNDFRLTTNPSTVNDHYKIHTEELRLASDEDKPLQWVGGLFYMDQPQVNDGTTTTLATATAAQFITVTTGLLVQDSYAAFGQATYSVVDWLRVTGGLRYTEDRGNNQFGSQTVGGTNLTLNAQTAGRWYAATWKAGLEADVTDKSMLYLTSGTGYTTGVLNSNLLPSLQKSQPEKVMHFELGSKNRFLRNHLQFDADAFYDDYSNYDTFTSTNVGALAGPGSTSNVVQNASKATIYGAGFNSDYLVTDDDRLGLAINYVHGRFGSFPSATPLAGAGAAKTVNYEGHPVPDAVPWTANISYDHTFELANGASLSARVDSRISSAFWLSYQEWQGTEQQSYTKTELSLSYTVPDGRWSVMGYVKNVEDAAVVNRVTLAPASGGIVPVEYGVDAPRTWGATLTAKF